MKIEQLLEFTAEDFKSMSNAATGIAQNAAAKAAPAVQKSIARNAAQTGTTPKATGTVIQPTAAPAAPVAQQAPAVNGTVTPAPQAGPTGDPTLDAPLPPGTPGTTFAQKVGSVAKGVGAVAGGVAGIGRAIKKGYGAGANAVGGPGAAPAGNGSRQIAPAGNGSRQIAPAGGQGGGDQIADLMARMQAMDARIRRLGV